MDKALTVIGVDQHMAHLPAADGIGNPPMQAHPIAPFAPVFAEGDAGRPDIFAVAG